MALAQILSQTDADRQGALDRLFELLRIESISTDSEYENECEEAADWLVAGLISIGFKAEKKITSGKPVVLAHGGKGDLHFLFYGHYDVQPIDPIELWDNPPFDPVIEKLATGDVIRARGAADDKGQLMTFIEACRAIVQTEGRLPCRVTLLLEGEEEIGSPSLAGFIQEYAGELKADYAFVCDTSMVDTETPSITTMLRGLCGIDFSIHTANRDLHSGQYGGPAINPLRVLSNLLAGLHDDTGRITLPGFYEGVPELPEEQLQQWKSLAAYEENMLAGVGLSVPAGE
ncbi:MAG: M20/M25/M40 family metallo-hydrolase [Rhodobacteraceae bacterium]|nr:M20/M25/M40 family metallo-hydrolase [Paracoccaceae bacterium]